MTVNHDVVGSSPTGGVIRHLKLYSLSFFVPKDKKGLEQLFQTYLIEDDQRF